MGCLAYMPSEVSMQALIHIALDLRVWWIYDQQGHLAYVLADLAKASIVHIALSDLMTSIVQQGMSFGS